MRNMQLVYLQLSKYMLQSIRNMILRKFWKSAPYFHLTDSFTSAMVNLLISVGVNFYTKDQSRDSTIGVFCKSSGCNYYGFLHLDYMILVLTN